MSIPAQSATPYIFLSYASAERERALRIADLLEAQGIPVWLDRKSIAGGTSWSAEIVRGIEGCTALLVLVSPASMASPNVQQEVQLAWEGRRPVLPLLLVTAEMPQTVRYALAGRQWVEVLDRPEEQWLPEALRALAGLGMPARESASAASAARSAAPGSTPAAVPARHNLPAQLTSFIGRERETAQVRELLAAHRLITLTGVGGTGKTRLALAVAGQLVDAYPDGVWLVALAPLADSDLVPRTVADVLGVYEQPNQPLLTTLLTVLKPRRLLLVLDNCEHLLDACVRLADALLRGCPSLTLLATSREALGMAGEHPWRVPSLALPDPEAMPPLEAGAQSEAVRLFVERATTVQPRFSMTQANATVVAQVCRRLDGIPLAIELAAARARSLSVEQLAQRLDDRFRLLTGGSRAALPRQQTLQATIDWSYNLLEEEERVLLRRLSVFAGGWTLAAAEQVCAEGIEEWAVLDLLTRLGDKSLVQVEEGGDELRHRLLETVRQYARDRLLQAGEGEAVRDRHLAWCLALVEQAAPALLTREQLIWLARLDAEHDNLRAALTWCLEQDPEAGLGLAGSLWLYWRVRSHYTEGRRWLESLLAQTSERSVHRAKALLGAGRLAGDQGDWPNARTRFEQSIALSREVEATHITAETLRELSTVFSFHGDFGQARVVVEEALALSRAAGDHHAVGACVYMLGVIVAWAGEYARGRALMEEGLALCRATGDRWTMAVALWALGGAALDEGDAERAEVLCTEGLAVAQELGSPRVAAFHRGCLGRAAYLRGDTMRAAVLLRENLAQYTDQGNKWGMGVTLHGLGLVAWKQDDHGRAATLLRQSLLLRREMGHQLGIAECLEGLAMVAVGQGLSEQAARLLGAAEALRQAVGAPRPPAEWPDYEATVRATQTALGEPAYREGWAAGQALTLEEAVAEALAEDEV